VSTPRDGSGVIVAVVGRPNVGKSTLFNRLAGKKLAIVDDQPGVTRDRHYAPAHIHGHNVTLVDTGGFDPTSGDPMQQGIARHVSAAIAEADVIVCVLDGTLPPTTPDREAVALLRSASKPVIYVANKVDNAGRALEASELFSLGVSKLVNVSALHGRGTAELALKVVAALPARVEEQPLDDDLPAAFMVDADEQASRSAGSSAHEAPEPDELRRRIEAGQVFVWEVDGAPVHVTAATAPAYDVSRIGPVYTPREHRGHGYGSAVTHAASRKALDDGATEVLLFTDLSNPTSNSIYQRLGYRPIADYNTIHFA